MSESRFPVGSSASRQRRLARERACDGDALLLTAGELRGNVMAARGEPDQLQHALDARLALGGLHAAIAQRHVDVVEHIEIRDQIEALEDEADLPVADARALVVVEPADVGAVQDVAARSSAASSRPAMLRKVVLPEPDGPVTETNSPFSTSRLKSRKACVSTRSVR